MKRNYLRTGVQWFFAAGFGLLVFLQTYDWFENPLYSWLGWFDPLAGAAGWLAGKWPWLILLSLAALALAAWKGRLFCGWVCPVGTMIDLSDGLKRFLHLPNHYPQSKTEMVLTWLRWGFLGAVVLFVLLKLPAALFLNPLVVWARDLDRLVNIAFPWTLTAFILLGAAFFPRFWCRWLCPAGSLLALAARFARLKKAESGCPACRSCRNACPMRNIDDELNFGFDCIHCGSCAVVCPAHEVAAGRPEQPASESRRQFLAMAGGGLAALVFGKIAPFLIEPSTQKPRFSRFLRPPATLNETQLALTCHRCHQCLRVCPTNVLVSAGSEAGWAGIGTPRFIARRGQCMFCSACASVCPNGCIVPATYQEAKIGTASIDRPRCRVWGQGIDCLLCVEVCPVFAVAAVDERPVVDTSLCIGCGACEARCPVADPAIIVYNEGEKRRG
jgi:ferredoxin-type protein NapF